MNYFKKLAWVFSLCALLTGLQAEAAVVVTPTNNGNCLPVAPGPYVTLSNIIITEALASDFAVQAGSTFILTAPAGFEFNPGIGSVTFTAGRDITSASVVVTNATITVTLSVGTNTNMDVLRIRSVRVRALSYNIVGSIQRTAVGGTAVVAGDAPAGGVNHGSLSASGTGASISSIADGPWSSPTTWFAGNIPGCTDNVVINHQVTSDYTVAINNLNINGGGNLVSNNAITVNGNFNMFGTGTYTHNNTTAASTTIFNGAESFSSSSTIIVNAWSSFAIPFATGVTGDFGAIQINTTGTWNQGGLFAPARIKNTLTVNSGLVILDNGSGMTTSLTLQDVMLGGTGRMQVQSGSARNLTLETGNFTDISSNALFSAIVYRSIGNLNWTVNGNVNISHRFVITEGQTALDAGNVNIQVNGDFTINGYPFDAMKKVDGTFIMNVTGHTLITGNPSLVNFKNYYNGDLSFTSGSMTVNNAPAVYFMGTNSTVGAADVQITGDLTVSGNSTYLYIASNNTNANVVNLTVGNDLVVTGGHLYTALTDGAVSVTVTRNYTQTGATSEFFGQRNTLATAATTVNVNGSASISDGAFTQSLSYGSTVTDIVEVLSVQNATFIGMGNTATGNYGIASLNCADLNLSGSNFTLHKGYITDNRIVDVTILNDLTINFTSASQTVMFVARNSNNTTGLDLNIGGNFLVFGTANGLFCSSVSWGDETIDIGGDLVVSEGRVRFNSYENYTARGHLVTGNISGSLIMSGGSICLSSNRGNADWIISGDYDQSGGYAVYKWYDAGYANITVSGNYYLNNGNATFYSRAATATSDPVTLTVHGNASMSNAVIMFDSCLTSSASHRIIFKGAAVTYGDNVIFDHTAHLSTRVVFGNITYDRLGTITLRRASSNFDIRHTKQYITPNTTVDFASSPFDLMISSHALAAAVTHTTLYVDGTLNMGTNMIVGRSQPSYYASVTISNGARLRTGHTGGLYSGSAANSCIYPLIAGSYRMNYFLGLTSTVEYNGVDNQRLTGVGLGTATTNDHRFGYIEINFGGTPDVEFVYITPSSDSSTIRTGLILTNGELNLDSDHVTSGGGSTLHLLNGATMTRTNGYLRSETDDGSGMVQWKINTTGTYVVHFGYNSTNYIPLTFQVTSGNPGNPTFATNRVAVDNTPYPPTVTHVNNTAGADNSINTVDRFWNLSSGGGITANITFSYTASEATGIVSPRAQLWEPVSRGWFPPNPVQSNPTAITTMVTGVTTLNNWWTMAPSGNPLPVEMISFSAKKSAQTVKLDWLTASEINNDFYTVERSISGESFTPIMQVPGAGTTSSATSYSVFDEMPNNGMNYYRLKQTDFDGRSTYSDIRSVSFKKESVVQIYPNPVVGQIISISTNNSDEKIIAVNIYDLAGKLMLKHDQFQNMINGNEIRLDLEKQLVQGTYVVEVNTADGIFHERVILQ